MDNKLYYGSIEDVIPDGLELTSYLEALVLPCINLDPLCISFKKNKNGTYELVELVPLSYESIFNRSSYLYDATNNMGKILVDNVLDEVKKEINNDKIHLYRYPYRPDNFDVNFDIESDPLAYLIHFPNELDKVNEITNSNYTKEDIVNYFGEHIKSKGRFNEVLLRSIVSNKPDWTHDILLTYINSRKKANSKTFMLLGDNLKEDDAKEILDYLDQELDKLIDFYEIDRPDKIVINTFGSYNSYFTYGSMYRNVLPDSNSSYSPSHNSINISIGQRYRVKKVETNILNNIVKIINYNYFKDKKLAWLDMGLARFFSEKYDEIGFRNWYVDAFLRRDRLIPDKLSDISELNEEFKDFNGSKIGQIIVYYLNEIGKLKEVVKDPSIVSDSIISDALSYYYYRLNIKSNLYDSNSLQDVMDWMNANIIYGYVSEDGETHEYNIDNLRETGILPNVEDIINKKVGTCIDQAKFIGHTLYQFGYDVHFYFLHEKDIYHERSHMTVVGHDWESDKWIYFEHSNTPKRGIVYFNSLEEFINYVKDDVRIITELPTIPDDITFKEFEEYVIDIENKNKQSISL